MNLGARVRELRKANGQKLLNISQQTGLSQPYISEIERGIKSPSVETLEKIAAALGITLADFFTDQTPELPPDIRRVCGKVQKLPPNKLKILEPVLDSWIEDD